VLLLVADAALIEFSVLGIGGELKYLKGTKIQQRGCSLSRNSGNGSPPGVKKWRKRFARVDAF